MLEYLTTQAPPVMFIAILMLFMATGDFLSKKTKALVPSIFVMVILLAIAGWTGIIPTDIVDRAGMGFATSDMAGDLLIVAMGTSLYLKDITSNWRVAIIGIVALIGVAIGCLLIGSPIFGWDTSVVATPVVGGGIVAMLEMQRAVIELITDPDRAYMLKSLAALTLAVQSLPAFIIIPPILKKVMKQDLSSVTETDLKSVHVVEVGEKKDDSTLLPEKYWSTATIILALAVVAVIAFWINQWLRTFMGQYAISVSVIGLVLGIALTQFRILPRNADDKAGMGGLLFLIVIFSAFSAVLGLDLPQFLELIKPVAGLIFVGIIGIFVTTFLVGKFVFKLNPYLCFVLGLNCLLGFPINYILTTETIGVVASTEEEKAYLTAKYVPMMLVAGFITITIGSVLLAGVMRGFL